MDAVSLPLSIYVLSPFQTCFSSREGPPLPRDINASSDLFRTPGVRIPVISFWTKSVAVL